MATTDGLPDAVRESYDRCVASGDFIGTFYDLFLASHPDVAPKFADTDFVKQKAILRGSVLMMIKWQAGEAHAREHLEAVAGTHGRAHLDIAPFLYEYWLDCLLRAISTHDEEYDAAVDEAWRERLRPAIAFIVGRYAG